MRFPSNLVGLHLSEALSLCEAKGLYASILYPSNTQDDIYEGTKGTPTLHLYDSYGIELCSYFVGNGGVLSYRSCLVV